MIVDAGKDVEKEELSSIATLQASIITLEISLVASQKIRHSTTGGPSYTTPGYIPNR